MLFEDQTGDLKFIVDGEAITAKRTVAVSAVATDLLARKDAKVLTLLGAGVQAEMHIASISHIREIEEVRVWSLTYEEANRFAQKMEKQFNLKVRGTYSVEEAVKGADIVCTLTPSVEPILMGQWVEAGTHTNAEGACSPNAREIDSALMAKSKIFVDSYESALNESGDVMIPIGEGLITKESIKCEIGSVILNNERGRGSSKEITLFESLGLAVEDLTVANYVYEQLKDEDI